MVASANDHQGEFGSDLLNATTYPAPTDGTAGLGVTRMSGVALPETANASVSLPGRSPTPNTTQGEVVTVLPPADISSTRTPEVASTTSLPPLTRSTSGKAEIAGLSATTVAAASTHLKPSISIRPPTTTATTYPVGSYIADKSSDIPPAPPPTSPQLPVEHPDISQKSLKKDTKQNLHDPKRNPPRDNNKIRNSSRISIQSPSEGEEPQPIESRFSGRPLPRGKTFLVRDVTRPTFQSTTQLPPRLPPPPVARRTKVPPVTGRKTNIQLDGVLKDSTGKSRTSSTNKIGVLSVPRPTDTDPAGGAPLAVVVVVPLVCVLVLLVVVAGLLLRRYRLRNGPGYKRRSYRDEENSSVVTSSLVSPEKPCNDGKSTTEPLYAIVDKSKKRRATESLSATEELLGLNDLVETTKKTVNGSCPAGDGSVGSLCAEVTRRDDTENEVFGGDTEERVYDLPPRECEEVESEAEKEKNSTRTESSSVQCNEQLPESNSRANGSNSRANGNGYQANRDGYQANGNGYQANGNGYQANGNAGLYHAGPDPERGHPNADLTLVECDVYEAADRYDPNTDDQDGMYEIPDSPATVRARRSMARFSALLQEEGADPASRPPTPSRLPPPPPPLLRRRVLDESLAIPQRIGAGGDTSDSDSDLDSDFEDMWSLAKARVQNGEDGDGDGDGDPAKTPPPVPKLLPESDSESMYYMSPKCHTHCPPGPDWKPFHEYDPVYVPHSDSGAMASRVDNQNYVRGRQRSDSRQTNPYEEIQFGGIYATVDNDDDDDDEVLRDTPAGSGRRNPIQVPPRVPLPPSPPPPLVPRRIRPISGVADMGWWDVNKPLPQPEPEAPAPVPVPAGAGAEAKPVASGHEPRYSGLIMDDVSDVEEDPDHEYTALEYTRLRSVGSGPLLGDDDEDIKAMDETDSETYTKQPFLRQPTLPPRLNHSPATRNSTVGNGVSPKVTNENGDNKEGFLFSNGGVVVNGGAVGDDSDSSSDSDDSYESVDFPPPKVHTTQ